MAHMTAPKACVEVERDTYFGVTVEDPYRWMEDWEGDEASAWLRAQGEHARSALGALPRRRELLERIGQLHGGTPALSQLAMAGDRTFSLRQDPEASVAALVVRDGPDGRERVLLDPATLPGETHSAIDWLVPSPDGARVACGISRGGSEASELHVLEAGSGALMDDRIAGTHFPFVSWLDDCRSFVYHRYREPPPGTPLSEARNDSRSCLHRLGEDPEGDAVVLERGLSGRVAMSPRDRPFISFPAGGDWMLAVVSHGALANTTNERLSPCTFYAAPRRALSDPASCPWTRVAGVEDGVLAFALAGDRLYLVSRLDAPRFRVIEVSLGSEPAGRRVVVPEGERVIEAVLPFGDDLLVRELDRGIGRLRRLRVADGEVEEVSLPADGGILEWAVHPHRPLALLQVASWTDAPRVLRYDGDGDGDAGHGTVADTGWVPPSEVDFGEVEARELQVPARDGTLIPMSVVHRKGLVLDGDNPALLTGYGSYGLNFDPSFEPEMLAWYERGGLYAVAHLRGGGELGAEWHAAGTGLRKETTITDFIDCAEYLVREGWTRPGRLAGEGGSAGGIPSGGALVRRPDLWAAMVMQVPLTNALRAELTPNGPINVPEFGSVSTEEGLRSLLIIDSYLRVRDGVDYPAVLLTTGMNDPRVAVWQPAKMAARLQAATASGAPVLLRIEEQGGHGFGGTRAQRDELLADILAFLLDRFGL
jgi:prolyl oligopeptidase